MKPLGAVAAIALNTFREAVRDRVLYSMLLFAVGIIFFSLVLGEIAPQEQRRLTIDVGLAGISLMAVLLAIVLGVTNLHKEIEKRTVYFILPMPVARWQFLMGKLLGMMWIILITLAVMGGTLLTVATWHTQALQSWVVVAGFLDVSAVILLYLAFKHRPQLWPTLFGLWMMGSGLFLSVKAEGSTELVIQCLCLIASETLVVTAIALLFSSFSTPLLSGALTFLIFVAGRELKWLDALVARLENPGVRTLVEVVETVFPNCYLFVPSVNVLEGRFLITEFPMAPWMLVGNAAWYAVVYAALVLGLAGIILWRRDFV